MRELGMDSSIQYHTRSKIGNAVKEDACENVEKLKIDKLKTISMSLESKCSTLCESLIEENIWRKLNTLFFIDWLEIFIWIIS